MNYFLSFIFHIITYIRGTEQVENHFLCPKNEYIDKLRRSFLECYIDFVKSRIKNLQESTADVSTDDKLITKLKSKNIQTYNDLRFFIFDDNKCGYFFNYFQSSILKRWNEILINNDVKIEDIKRQENLLDTSLSKFQKILRCCDASFFIKLKEKYKKKHEKNETIRYWHIYNFFFYTLDEKIQKENTINESKPVGKIYYDPLDINDKFMINKAIEKTFENAISNDKKSQIVLFTFDVSTLLYQFLKNLELTKKIIDVIDIKNFLINIITTLQELDKNKIETILKLCHFCQKHNVKIFFDIYNYYEQQPLLNFVLFNYLGLDKMRQILKIRSK